MATEFIQEDLVNNDFAYGLVLDRVGENGEIDELKYQISELKGDYENSLKDLTSK